jgi:type IV secretion system protein VirB10
MDLSGVPAFEGEVNRHFMAQFLGVTAYALISAEAPRDTPNQYGVAQPTFGGQFSDGYRSAMLPYVMKYLSLVPTVTLHAGMSIKIHTQDDMYVKPWGRVNTTVYSSES